MTIPENPVVTEAMNGQVTLLSSQIVNPRVVVALQNAIFVTILRQQKQNTH